MTIVECGDGLAIFNAVRLSEDAQADLDRLGRVKHLIKLSDSHALDEPYYEDRYAPEVWTLPGAKLQGVTGTRTLDAEGEGPVAGGKVIEYPGTLGWRECGYLLPNAGGTLITCDALQNHADNEGNSFLGGIMTSLLGFKGGVIVAPMWRKYQKVSGARLQHAMSRVLELSFENLVTGHGPAVIGGGAQRAREAIQGACAAR